MADFCGRSEASGRRKSGSGEESKGGTLLGGLEVRKSGGISTFHAAQPQGVDSSDSMTSTDELGNRPFQTQIKTVLHRVQHVGVVYHGCSYWRTGAGRVLKFSCSHTAGCRDAACIANGPSESYDSFALAALGGTPAVDGGK